MVLTISSDTNTYTIQNLLMYVQVIAEENLIRLRLNDPIEETDLNFIRSKLEEFEGQTVTLQTVDTFIVKMINVKDITHKNSQHSLFIEGESLSWN